MQRSGRRHQGTPLTVHAARPRACREIVARRLHDTDATTRKVTLGGILFFGVTTSAWTAWLSPWSLPLEDAARSMGLSLNWLIHLQQVSLGSPASVNTVASVAVACGMAFVAWSAYARRTGGTRKAIMAKPTGE
jgi:hypothetical protein